jgi:hypothetical protein
MILVIVQDNPIDLNIQKKDKRKKELEIVNKKNWIIIMMKNKRI